MTESPPAHSRHRPPCASWARRKPTVLILLVTLCVAALAGCGGSGSSSSGTLTTKKVQGYGTVLATSSGEPVYVLSADPPGASKCTGRCAADWPPVTKRGSLTAGSGVKESLLSTLKRPDGSEQVAYNKHALYTHPGAPVALSAGTDADGGIWYLVSPSGEVIKATNLGGY